MQMRFPCYVHGMLKMDSFSGVVRADKDSPARVVFTCPAERRINETRLEVRYSPTLAGAMVDALPYLVDYPYGCTEQTLNRFLPTVITQRILQRHEAGPEGHPEEADQPQRPGDRRRQGAGQGLEALSTATRSSTRTRCSRMVAGRRRAAGRACSCSDGGWGWFSGCGEHSWPHTTAVVVHGLQIAKAERRRSAAGHARTRRRLAQELPGRAGAACCRTPRPRSIPWKEHADNLDAFVYMVLVDAGASNNDMRDFLYRDRIDLAVYAKAMFGLALHKEQQAEKLAMILQEHRAVRRRRTTRTRRPTCSLPDDNRWWYWYGSEIEADAYYLKLLSRTNPKDAKAAAAGEVPAQQPQARDLLEQHARHGHLHRGDGRLPEGQRRGQAGHDRRGLARRQEAQGSQDRRRATCSPSTTSWC